MSTLTNTQIRNTYDALLKLADNGNLTTVLKEITDGLGNVTPLSISQIAIKSSVDIEASGFKTPTGVSSQFLKADGSIDSTIYTGDQDLSGYLLNTTDTLNGNLTVTGTTTVQGTGDSSFVGNVGIGTDSPSAKLNISGTSTGGAIDWTNTTATTGRSYRWVSLNTGGFAIEDLTASGAERMRITSGGDVQIAEDVFANNLSGTNTGDQDLSGYALTSSIPSGNQIIDWTVDNGATVIHSGNYTDTTYTSSDFTHNDLSGVSANEHIDWTGASTGTIHITNLPATAITSVQIASSQVAMLALTTQEGDVVVRSDENQTYMHNGGTAGTMADFTELATPTSDVTSVDGATGAVVLNHDTLAGFVSNEHIDWTADQGATNIHAGNYINTTYTNVSEFINDAGYTGDQDLSGYALTADYLPLSGGGALSGGVVNINTNTNANTLNISRDGSNSTQVMKIGVTDTVATFNYIEDTTNEGVGNFGQYQFQLGGNSLETTVTAFTITKTGISAPNFSGSSSGTNTGDQDLSGLVDLTTSQTVDGIKTFTSDMVIKNGDPTLGFVDTTTDADDFFIHVNSNNFYILSDRDDSGGNNGITGWDGAFPLQLESDTNKAYTFGNEIWHAGNLTISGTNTGDQDLSGYATTSASDGKYLLNTTDTLTGNLTVTGALEIGSNNAPLNGRTSGGALVGMLKVDQFNNTQLGDSGGAYALELVGSSFLYTGGNATFAGTTTVQGTGDSSFVGNVGIGTNSPDYKQHISTSEYIGQFIQSSYLNSSKYYSSTLIGYSDTNDQAGEFGYVYNSVTPADSFSYINTYGQAQGSQFALTAGGNVGIGTDNPSYKLQINGTPPATSGALINIRNSEATATNTTFGGIFFNSSPGNDFSIGKSNINSATTLSFRNGNNGASLMDITPSGNVGIGTDSPDRNLSVIGAFSLDDSDSSPTAGLLFSPSSGINRVFSRTANNVGLPVPLDIYSGSSLSMRIASNSNVGIGTDSPDSKLHIADSTNPIFTFERLDTTTIANEVIGQLNFKSTDSSDPNVNASIKVIKQDLSVGTVPMAITFETGVSGSLTERMRIDSTGNVGIGTASPDSKLNLEGAKNTSIITLGSTTNNSSWSVGDKYGAIDFYSADGSGAGAGVKASISYEVEAGATGSTNSMVFRSAGSSAGTNNIERMRIASAGTVSLTKSINNSNILELTTGNNSETANDKYQNIAFEHNSFGVITNTASIRSTMRTGYKGELQFLVKDTTLTEAMRITSAGNVGIGTDSPSSYFSGADNLVVKQASGGGGISIVTDTSSEGSLYFADGTAGGEQYRGGVVYNHNVEKLFLISGGATKATIESGGNVGIGTDSPNYPLHIESSSAVLLNLECTGASSFAQLSNSGGAAGIKSTANDLILWTSTSGTERMRITNGGDVTITGNVGIGTPSPSAKLNISGTGTGGAIDWTNTTATTGRSYRWVSLNAGGFAIEDLTAGAERMRITSGGDVRLNGILYTDNDTLTLVSGGTSGTSIVIDDLNNKATLNGEFIATNFILSSDKRLKNNVKQASDKHIDVKWKTFEMNSQEGQSRYGVIAQELEEVHPEFVRTDNEGMKSVAYIDLLIAKIAELEARLDKANI